MDGELTSCRATTRELPDYFPYVVIQEYITKITAQWDVPTRNFFDAVQKILTQYVKDVVNQHFSKFTHGGLYLNVM